MTAELHLNASTVGIQLQLSERIFDFAQLLAQGLERAANADGGNVGLSQSDQSFEREQVRKGKGFEDGNETLPLPAFELAFGQVEQAPDFLSRVRLRRCCRHAEILTSPDEQCRENSKLSLAHGADERFHVVQIFRQRFTALVRERVFG